MRLHSSFLWNAIFKYLPSHFMSSLYMCFYYTNVRTNSRFKFCIITILVGKLLNFFYTLTLSEMYLRDDISPQNVFFKKKILENSTIGTTCMFFGGFFCIKKNPKIRLSQMDQRHLTCTFRTYFQHIHFVFTFNFTVLHWHSFILAFCINITWCYIVFYFNVNANVLRREHKICSSYKTIIILFLLVAFYPQYC